ncbi:interleukin-20 receptor subunit alpha-like isoform 2-T2 [Discoglossus pictus]
MSDTALWSIMILLLFLLLPQAHSAKSICTIPKPGNVHFSSINMHNVVKWLPLNISGEVRYTVKYKEYGEDKWIENSGCTQITNTWCDLSNETSNYKRQYYVKVIATQKDKKCSKMTDRFYPYLDTKIGPPAVEVQPGDKSISINWSYPEIWKRHPTDDSLEKIYKHIKPQIYIYNNKTKQTWHIYDLNIKTLDSNTTYCVNVTLYMPSVSKSSEASVKCVTTPADRTSEEAVKVLCYYIVPAVLIIFTIFATSYCVYKYIHVSKLKQPQILNLHTIKIHNEIWVDANSVNINIINIEEDTCNLKMQETSISSEQNMKNKSEEEMIVDGNEINHKNEIMEEENEDYVTLRVEIPTNKPDISPYDMPHNLPDQRAISKPATDVIIMEGGQYGHLKNTSVNCSVQEENILELTGNAHKSHMILVNYVPKTFDNELEPVKQCFGELEETSTNCFTTYLTQEPFGSSLIDCGSLIAELSPSRHQLHMPTLYHNDCEESGSEGLLSKLYVTQKPDESSEEDELLKFRERWELNVEMQE